MAALEIDRLTLQIPGLPAEQGHRLAEMVAMKLAQAHWGAAQSTPRMNATVDAPPAGASLEQLAAAIVDELRRQMAAGG
jgi:hypothetical protein